MIRYDYQINPHNFTISELSLLFNQAKENWMNHLKSNKSNINQEIIFHLYDKFPVDKKLDNVESVNIFCSFSMPLNDQDKKGTLEIFIHKNERRI